MNNDKLHPNTTGVKRPRRYDSPVRREQARETRRQMVSAARRLFLEQGYVATTIAEIARAAGVASQTVYGAFGSKREILHAVMDTALGGDDAPLGMLERAGPQRMRQESDQRVQLRMLAHGVGEVLERAGPLFDVMRVAGRAEPQIAAAYGALQAERRENMGRLVDWIAANGPLRPGLSVDVAADIVWTLTSADVHRMLCRERGWTPDAYADWLATTLADALLP